MTANDFRKLALALPHTEERSHMNHPDFRVAGRIFATLGYPDKTRGMVKLSPEDQHYFSKDYPEVFVPGKAVGDAVAPPVCNSRQRKKMSFAKRSKPPGATSPPNAF
jgi:hypothetical protein